MKNLNLRLSTTLKNHLSLENGPAMDRQRLGNGPAKSITIFAVLLMLFVVGIGNAWATPTTIFSENFGSTSSTSAYGSYEGYSATTSMFTTGSAKSNYSGDGSVGKNDLAPANLSSGYTGASGLSGCYQQGVKNTTKTIIQISNIKITGYTDLHLSFGALGGSSSHTLNVYYKIDTGSKTSLISNGAITNASWTLVEEDIDDDGDNLTIWIEHTPSTGWMVRLDDIKITGTSSGSTYTVGYSDGGAASGSVPSSHTGLSGSKSITLRNPSTGGGDNGSLVAPSGKCFRGWTNDAGAHIYAAGASVKVTGATTFTAVWVDKPVVYLKNTMNWANAYVYFYSDSYWDSSNGSGSFTASASYVAGPIAMTWDNSTGLFSYTCPSYYTYTYVSFTKDEQSNYGNFNGTEAIYCNNDFQYDKVVVPSIKTGNVSKNNGGALYFTTYEYQTVGAASGTGYYFASSANTNAWETKGYEFSTTATANVIEYSRTFTANQSIEFKVFHHGEARGSNGATIAPITNWDCSTGTSNWRLCIGPAGTYTFSYNTSTNKLSITYPSVTHPAAGYAYFKKPDGWGDMKAYIYTNDDNRVSNWGSSPVMSETAEICDNTYYYAAIACGYDNVIFYNSSNDTQKTGAMSATSANSGGKWGDNSSTSWNTFPFYSITYDAGDGSGDMDATAGICPGADQAVAANTFTAPTNYHFTGWTAGSSVTVSGESTTSVPAGATIEDIGGNITLTAQWSNTTAITLSKGTAGSANGSVTATCGTKTLTSPTWVTYSGTSYRFLGYSKSGTPSEIVIDTDGNLVANTTYTDASGNWKSTLAEVTLVAQWQSGHTITWSANGSTYATTFVDTGNNLVLPGSTPTSCDDGDTDTYTTFIGWYSTAAGTSGSPTASISSCGTKATTSITPDANQTYYAVWGDGALVAGYTKEVTLDFSSNTNWSIPTSATTSTSETSYTSGDYTIKLAGDGSNGYYYNTSNSQVLIGKSGAYMKLPAFSFKVAKIVSTTPGGSVSGKVTWDAFVEVSSVDVSVSDALTGCTSGGTFLINSEYQTAGTIYKIKVTNANNLQIKKLEIYSQESGATGFISSCCSSTAVVTVTPTSSSLALDIDGSATTSVSVSQTGGGAGKYYPPTVTPAGAGVDFTTSYKTAAYSTTFTATAAGTYTVKADFTETAAACPKYGSATITVAANPILTPSTDEVAISATCGTASSATDITVDSRYLSSTSITASVTTSTGSGTFKISTDNSTFNTSNKTITGGTTSKVTGSHIYVRYDAIAEESGSATGTLTLTCGAKEVVIDLSATITCSAHTTLSSANPIQITAANGIWVEAANTVSVSGTCLTTNPDDASVSIRAYTNNAHFQIKTGGTTGEGAAKTSQGSSLSLVTNHSTATWSGSIGIVYKPAAHNTTETATLTVEVYRYGGSSVYDTQTFTLYGRSLPENFVLAVTDGSGNWFAVPADMVAPWGNSCSSGLSTYTPYPIEVNNTTTPTAISGSTPSRAVYTAAARTGSVNTNPQTLSFKSVALSDGETNYYLYGSVSAEGSATNIQNAAVASSEKQKWFLDVIDWSTKKYNMHLHSDLNTNLLSYYSGNVGQYSASGKKPDIYILPATSTCTAYLAPKNITCYDIDATNYTIQFKPDRTTSYEVSLDGSLWSDVTTSIVSECNDDDDLPTLITAELPLATYRGETVYIRVKDAGSCAESTTFNVPDPSITVNSGTWMTMSGIAGYAFSNSANSIEISGLSSCAGHTVDVSSNNSKISASVNQSTGVVTISMTAGNATAGTHTGTLTFTLAGGTTRTQNISITLITKATQEWDGGDNSHFWDGMLCDEEGILVNPTVYLSYDMYYNGSRISTIGDFSSYSTIYLKDLNTGTNVTAHSMTRLKASDGVYGVDLINLTSYRDLIVGHKYRLVWENHSEDNSIQDAVTNSSGVPYSDCHMDFVYTQDCSSPTLLPGCASGTTADVSWGNTKASCSNYTLEWFDRTESSLTNTSIKDNTSNLVIWAYGASCYEANNNYLDDWIVSNSSNDYKSATYGYQVGGTSVKNYIFTPRLNQLYASAGTSTVYEVTVTLQNTGTANAYAAQCYAVDNTTSSTSVITSGYSATYNGVSTTYFVTPQCPTSSTITSTFKVTGLTATSRIGFTCQTQGQKLYVKNVAIKRLVDGDHSSATIAKSEDSYTITGLTTGKTYYATLTCGSSTSNEITFTTASGAPSVAFYSDAGFTSAITEADVVPGTPKTVYVRGTNVYFCGEEIPVTINSCFNIDSKSLEYNSETHVLEGNITVSNICAAADGPLTVSISGEHELLLHCTGDHQIEVVQWATNGLKIESYVIVSGTPSSGALNVTTSGGTYDLSHASLDITSHANEFLKITWNGRVENFRVPVFINSSCNSSTLSNVTEESVIVVNANKTLTINSDLVCAGVEIYPTAKVQFSSGSLTADYIRLYNNGDTWANFAKLDVTGASTISVDNVYADFRINEDRYHYIALPFDIETDDVTYAAPIPNGGTPALRDATNNRAFYVRQYDGRARETNDKATETTYNVNMPHIGAKGGNYTMTAGRGYMIAIGDQNTATGHAKRTLRFPIAMSSTEWTAEKASSKVVGGSWVADGSDNGSARATNKGWNLVGNPFMRELAVTSTSSGISTGHLNSTGSVPMWEITSDAVRYITIYNAASDAFTYQSLASSFTLKPMAAFYIQMNDAKYINFQAEMAGQAAAIPALMREEAPAEQEVNVVLNLSNASQSDKAGVVLHSQYDVAYNETDDADYPKLMSNTQVALWSIAGEEKLASNGLPKTASENIPLGYQAPQAGQYTFTLNVEESDMTWLKHVWLTDFVQNQTYDLLLGAYEFNLTNADKRGDRFLLGIELYTTEEVPTDIEYGEESKEMSPQKFIYNNQMYILRGGVIYDATGKRVREINK